MRTAVLVDVKNMFFAARSAHNGKLDYGKLWDFFSKKHQIVRAIAYMVKRPDIDQGKFVSALNNIGFEVRSKDARLKRDKKDPKSFKGKELKKPDDKRSDYINANYDVLLTIDAISIADRVDCIILVSGDGVYVPLVRFLQSRGCRVEVAGFMGSTSSELSQIADNHVIISKAMVMDSKAEHTEHEHEDDIVDDESDIVDDSEQPVVEGQPTLTDTGFGILE